MARRIYLGKWQSTWNLPKYQAIRDRIREAFKGLVFVEEGHKYYLNGKEMECVSNVTHRFKEKFDTELVAQRTYNAHHGNPSSKYYGMSVEDIKRAWSKNSENACAHGTERHLFSENIYYFITEQFELISDEYTDRIHIDDDGRFYFEAIYPKEEAAIKFYEDMPDSYIPILPETKVFAEDLGYSGTFDLLVYYDATIDGRDDSKSGLLILDWKTNVDLYKNYNDNRLLAPFEFLLDAPISLYKLQLSLYEIPIKRLGFRVVGRRLMWLRPDGNYNKIPLETYSEKLECVLSSGIAC